MRKMIAGLTVASVFTVPASAQGMGPGECFLPPGNAQSNVAHLLGNPNDIWQQEFGFRNFGEAVHLVCGVGPQS